MNEPIPSASLEATRADAAAIIAITQQAVKEHNDTPEPPLNGKAPSTLPKSIADQMPEAIRNLESAPVGKKSQIVPQNGYLLLIHAPSDVAGKHSSGLYIASDERQGLVRARVEAVAPDVDARQFDPMDQYSRSKAFTPGDIVLCHHNDGHRWTSPEGKQFMLTKAENIQAKLVPVSDEAPPAEPPPLDCGVGASPLPATESGTMIATKVIRVRGHA